MPLMLRCLIPTLLLNGLLAGCAGDDSAPSDAASGRDWFVDVTETAGIDFIHDHGVSGDFHFTEITGSGCALLDIEGDGDLDIYFVNGAPVGESTRLGAPNRLYRNDGDWTFVDVTDESGTGDTTCGTGVTTGDYDNDGDDDLFVANFGPDRLYRNDGRGRFTEVGASAGVADPGWATSAVFVDVDGDGLLDLYVTRYVDYTVAGNRICYATDGARDYCGPQVYPPVHDRLYRNVGDGTFEDVTHLAGIGAARGSGLGVVDVDVDDDGDLDLYVANDGNANQLWRNEGGVFVDDGLFSGAAYNADGRAEAGMGVTAGDVDGDGDEDLFLSHLVGETNTLLLNDGRGIFEDRTDALGLGAASRPMTGFGTRFADLDNDGFLDLFVANGAVKRDAPPGDDPFPYGARNQLFRHRGTPGAMFEEVTAAGAALEALDVSRGTAFGDIDNDGDIDLVVTNVGAAPQVLRNDGAPGSWIGLELDAPGAPRGVSGARVIVEQGDRMILRASRRGGSYASANDARVHAGLGATEEAVTVRVRWPDGTWEAWPALDVRTYHTLARGSGAISGGARFTAAARGDETGASEPDALPARIVRPDPAAFEPAVAAQFARCLAAIDKRPTPGAIAALARHFHAYGHLADAEATYRAALERDDPRISYELAMVLAERGRLAEARERLERVLASDDVRPGVALRLAELARQAGDAEAARAALDQVHRSNTLGAALERGRLALDAGDADAAVAALMPVVEAAPTCGPAHYALARALRGAGRFDEARVAFAAAARLGELDLPRVDPWGRAIDELARGSVQLLHEGIRLLESAGDPAAIDRAIDFLERAVAADDQRAEAHGQLGAALLRRNRSRDAVAALDRALALDPSYADAHYNRALIDYQAGAYDAAITGFARAIDIRPRFFDAWLGRGLAREAAGAGGAIDDLGRAQELDPGDTRPYRHLERLYGELGREADAIALLERGVRYRPEDDVLQLRLARYLATASDPGLRDPARAVGILEPMVARRPHPRPLEVLALAHAAAGRLGPARAAAAEAITRARATGDSAAVTRIESWLDRLDLADSPR